ncbi:MAG: hypothetical protein KDE51_14870, partial [Anaerolineales bacterium]|nr:hypothetical protein [Anaerolineales bacterium]
MPRLASIEKAGFYATPVAITKQIASFFHAPYGGRVLDPCAGEGEALATLAKQLNLEPYGNELHSGRAAALAAALQPLHGREQLKH